MSVEYSCCGVVVDGCVGCGADGVLRVYGCGVGGGSLVDVDRVVVLLECRCCV